MVGKNSRLWFSNLEIDNQKCVFYLCKDAFSGLLSTDDFILGESRGARTPDLLGVNETL